MKNNIFRILIITLMLQGCTTTKWTPPWIVTEEGIVICPKCKVEMRYVPVYYGYPSDELVEICERGEGILGGCIIERKMPTKGFICPECGVKYLDKNKTEDVMNYFSPKHKGIRH